MMSFEIGSLVVVPIAGFDMQQQYEAIQRENIDRAVSGRAIKMMTDGFDKLKVTTSGSGWMPAGLQTINRSQQLVIKCILPRMEMADFNTRQAVLPAARRSDAGHAPWGFAIMPDGSSRKVVATLAGNVATVAATPGAVAYAVGYLPQIVAYVNAPSESGEAGTATYHWEITAEEV